MRMGCAGVCWATICCSCCCTASACCSDGGIGGALVSAAPATETSAPPMPPSEQQADAVQQQEHQIVAQQTPAQPILMENVPANPPKTAGDFLALPLIGLGLLCGGSTMLYRLRQQS